MSSLRKSATIATVSFLALVTLPVIGFRVADSFVERRTLAAAGTFGDFFGASAALISAAGFVAVIWSIRAEKLRHDRARHPFLTIDASVDHDRANLKNAAPTSAKLTSAKWEANILDLKLRLDSTIKNLTDEPALNPELSVLIDPDEMVSGLTHSTIDSLVSSAPIAGRDTASAGIVLSFSGPSAQALCKHFIALHELELRVSMKYESLQGAKWSTEVEYLVSLPADDSRSILDGTMTVTGSLGTRPPRVSSRAKPGSWHASSL